MKKASLEPTPKSLYLNRRQFIQGVSSASLAASPLISNAFTSVKNPDYAPNLTLTDPEHALKYNNFYEFGPRKSDPFEYADALVTDNWTLSVEGECEHPQSFKMDELAQLFPYEERIYRFRCVEGWSMVIPWSGFQLSKLLEKVKPTAQAKFVEFISIYDPKRLRGQRIPLLDWPYKEGLRLDEAMHPLTLMATGIYGEALPRQSGAPIRLIVPWKYGFKSAKSIVKIRLVKTQPITSWVQADAKEYGFYANVNPDVPHPRWSQAKERPLGSFFKQPTLRFNGYDEVADLYRGMDLHKNF